MFNNKKLKKQVTMCFVEVLDYQDIVDHNEPYVVTTVINELSSNLESILEFDNHGYVIQRDAAHIFAVWNAPTLLARHQYWAVRAAFECQHRVNQLNRNWQKMFRLKPILVRFGLHVGTPAVTTVGGAGRIVFTVSGEDADMTRNIVRVAKAHASVITCSPALHSFFCDQHISTDEFAFRPVARVAQRRAKSPVPVVLWEATSMFGSRGHQDAVNLAEATREAFVAAYSARTQED